MIELKEVNDPYFSHELVEKCDVCVNGRISCADYGKVVLKVCIFCGGKG